MDRRVVAAARAWVGTPYLHQASRCGVGADCLGVLRGVWRGLYGAEPEVPPAYSADWGETGGQEVLHRALARNFEDVSARSVQPGQVLLFRMRRGAVARHLGIVTEAGARPDFVHACCRAGVVETVLSPGWRLRIVARFRFPARRIAGR